MRAMLKASVFELTLPTYSSITLGLLPAADTIVGLSMIVDISYPLLVKV
jgi:hypothetical protein